MPVGYFLILGKSILCRFDLLVADLDGVELFFLIRFIRFCNANDCPRII